MAAPMAASVEDCAFSYHASCIAINGRGVLLHGPSGCGKSDLALRLLERGALLVGDDYCRYQTGDGRLYALPAPAIAGLLEVRGLGLFPVASCPRAPVHLHCLLSPGYREEERLPPARHVTLCGIDIPAITLDPFHASAVARLWLAALHSDRLGQIPDSLPTTGLDACGSPDGVLPS